MIFQNKKWVVSVFSFLLRVGVCYAQGGESTSERKGPDFVVEEGPASALSDRQSPQYVASSISIDSGTATGFGIGNYSYWEIGSDVKSISAQPGGLVLGIFENNLVRFNTATKEYVQASGYAYPPGYTQQRILDNGRGEIISCGLSPDLPGGTNQHGPILVHRYRSDNFTFIGGHSIPTAFNHAPVSLDMAISPSGEIFISGNDWINHGHSDEQVSGFIKRIASDFSSTISWVSPQLRSVMGVKLGSNGMVYAVGYTYNVNLNNMHNTSIWIGKFDSNLNLKGEIIYNKFPGSKNNGFEIGLDSNNNVYIVGGVSNKPWIGRFNQDLVLLLEETFSDVAEGHSGFFKEVVVANSEVFAVGELSTTNSTQSEMLMVQYTTSLSVKDAHRVGGSDGVFNSGNSISIDSQGLVYIGGFINSAHVSNYGNSGKGWLSAHTFDVGDPLPPDVKPMVYPNPFRPGKGHTNMYFNNLPETGTLKLFTLKGELVREIPVASGRAYWDVKNTAGESVSSGVYFALVDGQDSDKTFKVVIQR